MSFNIVTDPDDLLRIEIPPNVMRDVEEAVRRIEGLLPSIYRGLRNVLDMVPPETPERAMYHHELGVVEEILRFLDNPGKSYLIGVPFQPATIEDDETYVALYMGVPKSQFKVLGPVRCMVVIYPITVMFPDNMLRAAFAHELVHCTVGDPYEIITYKVEMMLTDLAPDLFLTVQYAPEHMLRAIVEYLKRNRVPVMDYETTDAVIMRAWTDPRYARQILSKSVMVQLKPSASWKD